jgi:hypothetical protein
MMVAPKIIRAATANLFLTTTRELDFRENLGFRFLQVAGITRSFFLALLMGLGCVVIDCGRGIKKPLESRAY